MDCYSGTSARRPHRTVCPPAARYFSSPLQEHSARSLFKYLTPFLSHSCALFCTHQKLNPFLFKRLRTLCPKTPGVGVPPLLLTSSFPSSVHSSKFRIPQVLYLPLLRKLPGCVPTIPILELMVSVHSENAFASIPGTSFSAFL